MPPSRRKIYIPLSLGHLIYTLEINACVRMLVVYKVHNHTKTFTLLTVTPRQCLCHYFNFYHSNFPPSWKKNTQGQQSKTCVYYVTQWQRFLLAQKHTIKTTVFLYLLYPRRYGFIIVVVRVCRDFLLATYSPHFFEDFFHIWQVA